MSSETKLNSFKLAIKNLAEVMAEPKTSIVRDAAIKRHEICYELAWKSVQELLKNEGLSGCQSPKNCFKEAFNQGWITDELGFAEMVKNRNLTTHTYNENLANDIYQSLPGYLVLFQALASIMVKYDLENDKFGGEE